MIAHFSGQLDIVYLGNLVEKRGEIKIIHDVSFVSLNAFVFLPSVKLST